MYRLYPKIPASTADAIFAAQDAFAPSQTIPDTIASEFTTVCAISLKPPPHRYQEVQIDGKIQYVSNAIKIYCKSVFDALNEDDSALVRFYKIEL